MALLMVAAAGCLGASAAPAPLPMGRGLRRRAHHDLIGFCAVLAAAAVGYLLTDRVLDHARCSGRCWSTTLVGAAPALADLLALLAGIAITLPLAPGGAGGALRDAAGRHGELHFAQPRRLGLPGLHRVSSWRRLRRQPDDAFPAEGDGLRLGRGRRGQQGDRAVADDQRRALAAR